MASSDRRTILPGDGYGSMAGARPGFNDRPVSSAVDRDLRVDATMQGSRLASNVPSSANGKLDPPGYNRSADGPPTDHSILRSSDKLGGRPSKANVAELILVPWLFLVLVLVSFLQGGTFGYYRTLAVIPAVLLTLNILFLRHHYARRDNNEVILGILCMTAILISLVIATYGVLGSLVEYHRLSQGASYYNVLPSEAAAGKLDATTLVFTDASMVDATHTFGFTDTTSKASPTYCVAPVSDGDLYQQRIQYWAAGLNCCEARSNFACFDAKSVGAHGAVVLPTGSQRLEGFRSAVLGASGAYGLTAGDEFLLLTWTKDPVGYRNGLWSSTVTLFVVFSAVYLLISVMIGLALLPALTGK